ncbi:MAG: autotransporter outer membrane beta-barrel domain-containing protein, partial [Pseudomonadota bacterium]
LIRISERANFALRSLYQPQSLALRPRSDGVSFSGQGLAAGDTFTVPVGIWGSGSYTDAEADGDDAPFDTKRYAFLGGVDVSLLENVLLGLAVGFDRTDTDTNFNRGEQTTDGFTFAPYFAARFLEHWSVDFSIGYSALDIDQFRLAPTTDERINSDLDAKRWFFSGNANYQRIFGNWILSGRTGITWARDDYDDFVESDGTRVEEDSLQLGQVRVGAEVAYAWGQFEPFISGTYENDYKRSRANVSNAIDDTGGVIGFGLRFFGGNGISGTLEYNTVIGRDDYDEDSINFLFRAEF